MKWITREKVKVDRVACPWLIKKFVDKEAEFVFVPTNRVMDEAQRLGATPFDVAGVELGHHGKECSFEAIVKKYGLSDNLALVCSARSSTAQTPTTRSGISPKGQASKPSPKAFAIWASRTTIRSTPPSGLSMTRSMPTARKWCARRSRRGCFEITTDGFILFGTRVARMFAYGFLSVVLVLYLSELGFSEPVIGVLLSLTLIGDAVISLIMTTTADRFGRRRVLIIGAGLMLFAGMLFAFTSSLSLLLIAAIVGVISPSGYEVGPFLAVEQAALSQAVPDKERTRVFAWYNLVGSFATAFGALAGGGLSGILQKAGGTPLNSYRAILLGYAVIGVLLASLFIRLSSAIEVSRPPDGSTTLQSRFGLHRSRGVVMKLCSLFGLDAFAGGFVIQSIVAYWFHVRFGVDPATLGGIFFAANILAGISALAAAWVAARIGLVNTMVFTHLPSNILLLLVPLMPNLPLAIAVLLLRFSISQMDVPPRQSYTMAVVAPDERSAAAGVTGITRTIGASLSPALAGLLISNPALLGAPFFLAGGLKVVYDLLLYRSFRALKAPEEHSVR